jgi:hypothetical protein
MENAGEMRFDRKLRIGDPMDRGFYDSDGGTNIE